MESVADRFFEAFSLLHGRGEIGVREFCRKADVNVSSFVRRKNGNSTSGEVPTTYLTSIVDNCGVSAKWLLTGKGEMFEKYNQNK